MTVDRPLVHILRGVHGYRSYCGEVKWTAPAGWVVRVAGAVSTDHWVPLNEEQVSPRFPARALCVKCVARVPALLRHG